jgi:hypothetical protein
VPPYHGKWDPLKVYEGFQVYINPESGQFGVQLGKFSDTWMARKDLKVIEREIRKRVGGIPVIMTSGENAVRAEVTGWEKDEWLTADGGKHRDWNVKIYPFDEQLLADLEALVEERKELEKQLADIADRRYAILRQHTPIRSQDLPDLIAATRARSAAAEEPEE